MKRFKKVILLPVAAVLLLGVAVFLALRSVPAPAAPVLWREEPPEADDLREALEVEGVGDSRFFIQYPHEAALHIAIYPHFFVKRQKSVLQLDLHAFFTAPYQYEIYKC